TCIAAFQNEISFFQLTLVGLRFIILVDHGKPVFVLLWDEAQLSAFEELAILHFSRQKNILAFEAPAPRRGFLPYFTFVFIGSAVALPTSDVILQSLKSLLDLRLPAAGARVGKKYHCDKDEGKGCQAFHGKSRMK